LQAHVCKAPCAERDRGSNFCIMSSALARADAPVVNKTPTAKAQAATTDGTPVKVSQQDKMRLCAKQASGKKGAERKAFMKTYLSAKKA